MRAAAHLDPQLSAENVVGTLKAAKLYMIESLVTLCTHYIVNIKPEEVLRMMTSARATAYQNELSRAAARAARPYRSRLQCGATARRRAHRERLARQEHPAVGRGERRVKESAALEGNDDDSSLLGRSLQADNSTMTTADC